MRILHRHSLAVILLWLFTCIVLQSVSADDRPNLILMMGDDHGWEETGFHGHPHVRTPVLDEMARTGLRLDQFYAAHPNCSPTRASFLTGRHPNRMGTFAPGWSFRPEEITLAAMLRQSGYRCAHFGKWHTGPVRKDSPVSPGSMGFDEWVSHDNFFELNPVLSRNGADPQRIEGESSAILVDEAVKFLERCQQQGQPFLIVLWFGSPHEPYSGLAEDLELYADLPARYTKPVTVTSNETGQQIQVSQGQVLQARYAEITAMDRAIGRLRGRLSDIGLRDNTLLFYCGDNGTSADAALGAPHRGTKGTMYQGGLLVPGLIEWPRRIPRPRISSVPASTSDLLPTVCHLAGVDLPQRPLDGQDLSGLLEGSELIRDQPLFFWEYISAGRNRGDPWIDPRLQAGTTPLVKKMGGKATRDFTNFHYDTWDEQSRRGPRAVVDGEWKLVLAGRQAELFNLRADPAELRNLAETESATVQRLTEQLQQWQTGVLNSLTGADYRPR